MTLRERLFSGNLGVKIASVIIAILMWFFTAFKGQSEIGFELPLEFKDIPMGFEITAQNVNSVNVKIRGLERLIDQLRPKDVNVTVPLDTAGEGEMTYYLTKKNVRLPSSLMATSITPTSVRIILERTSSKLVEIRPVTTGKLPDKYELGNIYVSPHHVEVRGARSILDKVTYIRTVPIDITGRQSTFSRDVGLSTEGRSIKISSEKIHVTVRIKELQ